MAKVEEESACFSVVDSCSLDTKLDISWGHLKQNNTDEWAPKQWPGLIPKQETCSQNALYLELQQWGDHKSEDYTLCSQACVYSFTKTSKVCKLSTPKMVKDGEGSSEQKCLLKAVSTSLLNFLFCKRLSNSVFSTKLAAFGPPWPSEGQHLVQYSIDNSLKFELKNLHWENFGKYIA